jgi:hypothetical protein
VDAWPSTRSSSRERKSSQRGFAIVLALVLAVLYFGLIELLMIDSSRELAEARRFRARIVAEMLAENAAELAAKEIVTKDASNVTAEDWQGTMSGRMLKSTGGAFDIEAEGKSTGLTESKARVIVRGRVVGKDVRIQYTQHVH